MLETAASPPAARAADRRLPAWWGWAALGVISVIVLATWLPHIGAPLGDSAEGRVLARLGLHVRNFWSAGAVDSGFASSMAPYVFSTNYAHHPPLVNAFEVATSAVLGEGVAQLRVYGYVAGIASLWFLTALLRQLRLAWGPILLSVGLMAATNMYWIYGRVGGGFAMILGLAALVVYVREHRHPTPLMVTLTVVAGAATVMTSWPAAATAGLLGLWLLKGRGLDRVTWAVGLGMLAGALLTVVWILNATSLDELATQTGLRTGGEFTWMEFLERQWFRATQLTPGWYRVLLFPALAAGIADRRSRWVTLILFLPQFAWTFGGREGAFNHEFWNLPWMAAAGVGIAVLFDAIARSLPRPLMATAAMGVALLALVGFANVVRGPAYDLYFGRAADAGALVEAFEPPPDQDRAWALQNVPAARWLSYYWGLTVRVVTEDNLADVPDGHVVVVRVQPAPAWLDADLESIALRTRGRYAVVNAAALKSLAADG